MAQNKKVTKIVDKWKKKRWFKVFATKEFNETLLGETPADNPNMLIGRTITANLMTLTGNIQNQFVNITFEINTLRGDSAYTIVKTFEVVQSSIKRKIRRQKDKLDRSFLCLTKDDVLIRIKPIIITNAKTTSSVKKVLSNMAVSNILILIRTLDYRTLVSDLVSFKFQKALKNTLKKVFPIKVAEIRYLTLEKETANNKSVCEKLRKLNTNMAVKPAPQKEEVDIVEESTEKPSEENSKKELNEEKI